MAISLAYALACESATVDQQTNQLSIFKVIETVQTPGPFPATLPKATFILVWIRDSGDSVENSIFRIKVKQPNGRTNIKEDGSFQSSFSEGIKRVRTIIDMVGFPVSGYGRHLVTIEKKAGSRWTEAGEVALDVEQPVVPPGR